MAMPITREQAHSVAGWMKGNFRESMTRAVEGTPFSVDVLCAIARQETAYFWLSFVRKMSMDQVLARCVLDASGDAPGTTRKAFPKNSAEFRARFGDDFANMLIAEANETRKLRGYGAKDWVYKGYGLFQYDLQHVDGDRDFFEQKLWYDFGSCLSRVTKELNGKYERHGDLRKTIKAYNGSGKAAEAYAANVMKYIDYCAEVSA